jgi:hypothetical protein
VLASIRHPRQAFGLIQELGDGPRDSM